MTVLTHVTFLFPLLLPCLSFCFGCKMFSYLLVAAAVVMMMNWWRLICQYERLDSVFVVWCANGTRELLWGGGMSCHLPTLLAPPYVCLIPVASPFMVAYVMDSSRVSSSSFSSCSSSSCSSSFYCSFSSSSSSSSFYCSCSSSFSFYCSWSSSFLYSSFFSSFGVMGVPGCLLPLLLLFLLVWCDGGAWVPPPFTPPSSPRLSSTKLNNWCDGGCLGAWVRVWTYRVSRRCRHLFRILVWVWASASETPTIRPSNCLGICPVSFLLSTSLSFFFCFFLFSPFPHSLSLSLSLSVSLSLSLFLSLSRSHSIFLLLCSTFFALCGVA
jgi:hypothetical protein